MNLAEQERALLRLAVHLGVQVRQEPFDTSFFAQAGQRGGLCLVRGRPVIFLDNALALVDRVVLLCEALCTFDYQPSGLDPPLLRRLDLARRRRRAHGKLRRPPLHRVG